jgi:hypothetical protein
MTETWSRPIVILSVSPKCGRPAAEESKRAHPWTGGACPRKQAISPTENGQWRILLECGEGLHPVLRRNSAYISDCAWSGSDVFDKGRFGIECLGHGALSGEHHLAPL